MAELRKYLTVRQLSELYPAFTVSALRYWIITAKVNGLEPCITRLGRKVLIDAEMFQSWIEKHKEEAANEN